MIDVLVIGRGIKIGVATSATLDDVLNSYDLGSSIRLQAIEAVEALDAQELKRLFLEEIDSMKAYPFTHTELEG